MIFAPGATSQSIDVLVVDDTGLPVSGLVAATFPTIKYSLAGANADVTITPSDLASLVTAWTSSGVKERGEGRYRLDLPNAALASAGMVTIRGEDTGKRLICEPITVVNVGTSTLTQTQVTGGAYALNSSSFAFNAALPLTTQQKADVTAAVPTAAEITSAVWGAVARTLTSLSGLTVDTVTTLTTLPTAPTDWVTAAAVSAAAVTKIQSGLSTYAGADTSGTTDLLSRLSSSRAGYLDNLNVGGVVASQSDINTLNQSASRRVLLTTSPQFERPESGSNTYQIQARTYDGDGAATNADSTPTLTATGITSGSLAGNLSVASSPATGVYRWTYTVANNATQEQVRFDLSATIGGSTFTIESFTQVVDLVSATWTSTDASHLAAIYDKLPSKTYLTGTNNSDGDVQMDEATGNFPGSVGSISGITFPTNFGVLGVNSSGHISRVVLTDTVTTYTGNTPQTGDAYAAVSALSVPTTAQIADKVLGRNLAGGSDGGRTVKDALRASRNKVAFDVPSSGQFTVYAEDDTTPAWVGTYTRSADAVNALTVVDPS